MGWKKLFEKFQEGCLVHDHLWYLSGMKKHFLVPVWPDQSNQVSAHKDIPFRGRFFLKNIKMAI